MHKNKGPEIIAGERESSESESECAPWRQWQTWVTSRAKICRSRRVSLSLHTLCRQFVYVIQKSGTNNAFNSHGWNDWTLNMHAFYYYQSTKYNGIFINDSTRKKPPKTFHPTVREREIETMACAAYTHNNLCSRLVLFCSTEKLNFSYEFSTHCSYHWLMIFNLRLRPPYTNIKYSELYTTVHKSSFAEHVFIWVDSQFGCSLHPMTWRGEKAIIHLSIALLFFLYAFFFTLYACVSNFTLLLSSVRWW